jgi:hypothetical protein
LSLELSTFSFYLLSALSLELLLLPTFSTSHLLNFFPLIFRIPHSHFPPGRRPRPYGPEAEFHRLHHPNHPIIQVFIF